MRKGFKIAGVVFAAILILATVGFYAWTRVARYPAFPEAVALAEQAESEEGWYIFEPDGEPVAGLIFYPGGLVDPAAYSPLMQRLGDGGVLAVIVPMPLDLAVLAIDRADKVVEAYPDIDSWVISGHSLGGAMAAEYVKRNPDAVDGLAFLAAYPSDSTDLSELSIQVVSIYGTEDGVTGDVFEESLHLLPPDTLLTVIVGGNHAQFGQYGPQDGDGTSTITREDQQEQAAETILELVARMTP